MNEISSSETLNNRLELISLSENLELHLFRDPVRVLYLPDSTGSGLKTSFLGRIRSVRTLH